MANEQIPGGTPEQTGNPDSITFEELREWLTQESETLKTTGVIIDIEGLDPEKATHLYDLRRSYLTGESAAVARLAQHLDHKEKSHPTVD